MAAVSTRRAPARSASAKRAARSVSSVLWAVASFGCAPELGVEPPSGPVAGELRLTAHTPAPRVRVTVDGQPALDAPSDGIALDTRAWTDGEHVVVVSAGWPFARRVELRVRSDNTGPRIELDPRVRRVEQGHTLLVIARVSEPATVVVDALGRERAAFPLDPFAHRALIGVPIRTPAGPLPVEVRATDALGNVSSLSVEVDVQPVDWVISGRLPLSKKAATVDDARVAQMRAERDAVYRTSSPDALWTGPFALPLVGTHTSAFGTFREYPDGSRSHHDAEDIGRRRGTPVLAPAPGIVALAHLQEVHGNAVLLDHGQGVISLYSHLDGLDVAVGERVQTGQQLGRVGSTGRSTGPHLHWGVVVDQVPVDPMQWTDEDFPGR